MSPLLPNGSDIAALIVGATSIGAVLVVVLGGAYLFAQAVIGRIKKPVRRPE